MTPDDRDTVDLAYRVLSGDDSDERACSAIPEDACTDVPRNYVLNVANGACTKLAEQLASPGLVLPWLLATIGAPATFVAFLTPIKQVGSLLPQMAVAGWIRSLARRKWAWVAAGLGQAVMLCLLAAAVVAMPPVAAGVAVLGLYLVFNVLSGVGSVAFQDVVGKTIPKGRRGRMLANRAMIGGGLTLAAAAYMRFGVGDPEQLDLLLTLVLGAALLWAAGAAFFAFIAERAGATEGGRSMAKELALAKGLFREVRGYRRYLYSRGLLLLGVELAMPFFALDAVDRFGSSPELLALLVFSVGVANIVSSPLWGAWSDGASRAVMAASGAVGAFAAAGALAFGLLPEPLQTPWLYAVLLVSLGIAQAGVRLGRKTYLVDGAPADERPLYVAFANTVAGGVALVGGLFGVIADLASVTMVLGLLAILAALGAVAARRLPPAEEMAR
jgi:hypothetical protein